MPHDAATHAVPWASSTAKPSITRVLNSWVPIIAARLLDSRSRITPQ